MRGKGVFRVVRRQRVGITPAHAGKRSNGSYYWQRKKDHPRACGEKFATSYQLPSSAGSPPRMRGKDYVVQLGNVSLGITPAHAGKSSSAVCVGATNRGSPPAHAGKRHGITGNLYARKDHPRACGEKACSYRHRMLRRGSPPRMRGKAYHLLIQL